MLEPLYKTGVALFKNDDGEYLPLDAKSNLGMKGKEYHNIYGFFYGKAIYEGMEKLDSRRPLIYARSVWAGSQRYPAIFLGDQIPNFENIYRTIKAGLNMSLLGFAYWTADVFGLFGRTTPEIHMRYAQWALMSPIARYFIRPPQTDDTRFPWSHNERVEDNFRRHVDLRYRLLPYYYQLGWEAYLTGIPLIRPLFMEFPEDQRTHHLDDQVLLGGLMMLAPVLHPDTSHRNIYFPNGTWYDYWSDKAYAGGNDYEMPVSLEHLPIFIHENAIIPMGPSQQYIPDDHRFNRLEFHFWPGFNQEIDFYEDDGLTREYQTGAFSLTNVSISNNGQQITIQVKPSRGTFYHQEKERIVEFWLHNITNPSRIDISGVRESSWHPLVDKNQLRIQTRSDISSHVMISICHTGF